MLLEINSFKCNTPRYLRNELLAGFYQNAYCFCEKKKSNKLSEKSVEI